MTADAYLEFPMAGLGFADDELLVWLHTHVDPHLWHLLACEMFCETLAHLDVLLWIVQQPECDKATAAAVFVLIYADDYLYTPPNPQLAWSEHYDQIAATICANSATGFYTRSAIADPSDSLERPLHNVLGQIDEQRTIHASHEPRLTPPDALLAWEFPDTSFERRYVIEQDAVIRLDAYEEPVRATFPSRWPQRL